MAISHREHRQDMTVLSRLVGGCSRRELNLWQDKTACDWKFRNSFILSWPSFQFARNITWLPIVTSFGNWVKTSSQMRSHRKQDKTVLSPNIENCVRLSRTQFTPPTRQDTTVLSCRCLRSELAITLQSISINCILSRFYFREFSVRCGVSSITRLNTVNAVRFPKYRLSMISLLFFRLRYFPDLFTGGSRVGVRWVRTNSLPHQRQRNFLKQLL